MSASSTRQSSVEPINSITCVTFREILLNVDWRQGESDRATLPTTPGIYAEVFWPARAVRIGETGLSIRAKVGQDWSWLRSMGDGTAPATQLRRSHPICAAAREFGSDGFEAFLVSDDPQLLDKTVRQECERYLFEYVRASEWIDWNRQRSWR